MLSYEPEAQTSSDGRMLLEMPTTPKMFCAVTLRKPPKCSRPPKKNLGYVTLARNMPMPTPCFLVRLPYAAESCPSVAYTTVIKINIFWGELTDNSAIKEALLLRLPFTKKLLVTLRWLAICPCPRLVFWFSYVTLLSQLKCCLHYGIQVTLVITKLVLTFGAYRKPKRPKMEQILRLTGIFLEVTFVIRYPEARKYFGMRAKTTILL